MNQVFRSRSALSNRAPAAATTLAAGGVAVAPFQVLPYDPIPALYEDWKQFSAEWKAAIGSANEGRLKTAVRDLEERICTTVPTTQQGMIAQLEYAMEDFGQYMFGNVRADLDRELFLNLLNGLKAAS